MSRQRHVCQPAVRQLWQLQDSRSDTQPLNTQTLALLQEKLQWDEINRSFVFWNLQPLSGSEINISGNNEAHRTKGRGIGASSWRSPRCSIRWLVIGLEWRTVLQSCSSPCPALWRYRCTFPASSGASETASPWPGRHRASVRQAKTQWTSSQTSLTFSWKLLIW